VTAGEQQCENGHPVRSGLSFCTQCGAGLAAGAAGPARCANGHEVRDGLSFCTQCGARVGVGSAWPGPSRAVVAPPLTYGNPASAYGPVAAAPPGYWPPPMPQQGAALAAYAYQQAPFSLLAIAAFVCALNWIWFLNAAAAVVIAILAIRRIKERGQRGLGLAIAAIAISALELLIGVAALASSSRGSSLAHVGVSLALHAWR
jgi:hypothetical protein